MTKLGETGVLLVNLGTPLSPKAEDVRRYLKEFLLDPRVMDLPRWKREILVRFFIIPKRIKETIHSYKMIWTDRGSPLLFWGEKVKEKLEISLGDEFSIKLAMRYQAPSIKEQLSTFKHCRRLVIIPLFPQYASATTGSILSVIMKELSSWSTIPSLNILTSYPTNEKMIEAFAERGRAMGYQDYEQILFSFHGLPLSHLEKSDVTNTCLSLKDCCFREPSRSINLSCYARECFMTAKAIAHALSLPKDKYKITFQSRLGKEPWLEPSTQDTIREMAREGIKKVLLFSPSFVADCLETLFEIKEELKNEFLHLGGKQLDLVPSLNDHPLWINSLKNLVLSK